MSSEKPRVPVIQKKFARALFLDRDGVVNEEIGYLSRSDQVRFLPGIFDLCRKAQSLGYILIIVTNQAGIARGYYSETEFHVLMQWMTGEFAREGIRLDRYYFCPHHPEHGVGAYRLDCQDRKPNPGMFLNAATEFHLDLARSIFLGDRCTDMVAGRAAGVGTLVLVEGQEVKPCDEPEKFRRVKNLLMASESLT
ncbi:MAG TPA: HAD family hydrolase [Acidobacteriaceae bacterium]|jgi:D-glycero-D-manno-heptose 1,7-bisphosphate phosphatase|nr:HAD family hydrolase [Acidobacteriaceae bacterium]